MKRSFGWVRLPKTKSEKVKTFKTVKKKNFLNLAIL